MYATTYIDSNKFTQENDCSSNRVAVVADLYILQ